MSEEISPAVLSPPASKLHFESTEGRERKGMYRKKIGGKAIALLLCFMVAVAGAVALITPRAWAASDGVQVIQRITSNGMYDGTIQGVQSLVSFQNPQPLKVGNDTVTRQWLVTSVNPQVSSPSITLKPTIGTRFDATGKNGDIMVSVSGDGETAGSPVKHLMHNGTVARDGTTAYNQATAADWETCNASGWFYDVETGTAYISPSYTGKSITIYDYLLSTQTCSDANRFVYAREFVDGTEVSLSGTTARDNLITYKSQGRAPWYLPFSSNVKSGYKFEVKNVYAVAMDDQNNITSKWKLDKSDYSLNSKTGQIKFSDSLCIGTVILESHVTTDPAALSIVVDNKTTDSIIVQSAPSGYTFQVYSANGKTLVTSVPSSSGRTTTLSGLQPGTKYLIKLVSPNGQVVTSKSVKTKLTPTDTEADFTPVFQEGQVFHMKAHVSTHHDTSDPSEPSGICTMFYCQILCEDMTGGTQEAREEFAAQFDKTWHWFHCATPFAHYTDGKTVPLTVRCTSADNNDAKFYAYGDASVHGWYQSFDGNLNSPNIQPIEIHVLKKPVYPDEISDNNQSYSLAGAVFRVWGEDIDKSNALTGETDDTGYVEFKDLKPGTYHVQEIEAPEGFALNDKIYDVSGSSGETVELDAKDEEQRGVPFEITKFDYQTDKSHPQGDGDLDDIIFEVAYIPGYYNTATEAEGHRTEERAATWFLKTIYDTPNTDTNAKAKFDNAHKVASFNGKASDPFYEINGKIVCPLGTYIVREVKSVDGIEITDRTPEQVTTGEWRLFHLKVPGAIAGTTDTTSFTFTDIAGGNGTTTQLEGITEFKDVHWHGNIELIKADDNWNGSRLQGDATLKDAEFEVFNASQWNVVSPQTGLEVEPGKVVCTIKSYLDTDGKYKATTNCPSGSLAAIANGWSIPTDYAFRDGALAYGQYVVAETKAPLGYLLNSEWVGRAIDNNNVHTGITFKPTNWTNSFTLAGKTSNASATPTWINAQKALVKFDNKKANENKASQEHYHNNDAVPQPGASLDTVERVDESWCEDTIFRAGVRIGKVDRQNGDYKPQGGATLETAVITISSLCDNPIWTLKGTYANGQKPTWGEVEAWNGNTSKKDGVDFLNIVVHKVTKTDGTVQYYASTRDDKGVAGVDFDDGALDLTLPYGRYMLREISVDSPDKIYDTLTNINNGYLYDTISQNWRRQFSIGYETNTKHPAITYYNETGSFSTLLQGDAVAAPSAIRVTPTDTVKYTPTDPKNDASGTNHGKILDMTATTDAIPNLVSRFDIEFIKKDVDDKLLAGAAFLITSKTTGESHIAITDENGKFSSYPENQLSWHTKKNSIGVTNGNDEGILTLKSEAGITYMKLNTNEDGSISIDTSEGIARTQTDDGKVIVDSTNAKTTNGVWFYGRIDKKSYDAATGTGNGSGGVTGNVNEDTTHYISSVKPDDIQMVRNDLGAFPYDDYIVQELPTATTVDYKMQTFEIHMSQATKASPSDGLKNRTEMELKSPDPILRTAYPEYFTPNSIDAGTVTDEGRPSLHTTLANAEGTPIASATENYTLIDKVQWFNLTNGHKYKLRGELWQKDENNKIIGDKPIATKEQTFIAKGTDGTESMEFANLDLTKLGGASLVCFEYLYDTEDEANIVSEHADATDEGQTVTIPEIRTTLTDSDGDKEVSAYKEVKLIDHVSYKGLKPGQMYTFTGTLHLQDYDAEGNIIDGGVATDSSGNPITATKDVTVETRDGVVDIEFTFMAPNLGGKKVVAFEEALVLGKPYAVHTDITDNEQTVYFPEIGTTALDGVTGDHIGLADAEVTLEDVVEYKNLVKGKTYTINGTLMDQGTGEPIQVAGGENITGTFTFVAGYVEKAAEDTKVVASIDDLKTALNKADGISTADADQLAVLSEKLTKDFDDNKTELTEEKVLALLEAAKTELGDKVKDINFEALATVAKAYFKKLADAQSGGMVEDPDATFTKFNDKITLVSGKVKVPFKMNADDIRGKAIVVFERLYNEDTPEPDGEHEVEISKTDVATSKELPGATLIVTDSSGNKVAEWVSGDTPKKIKLNEGTYTLTEYTAPKGYTVTESIEFKVDSKGLVGGDKVEMKNASKDIPEGDKEVEISKTDAATSKELPGATLIVQDSTGTTVEQWVSGDTPKKIKLTEGTYKLIEITAPNGYAVAETIEFKVDANGLVGSDHVKMEDSPKSTEPVAIHEDINDSNQQVNYPDICTTANVAGAKSGVTAAGEVHLTDVVTYTNLIPGREYVMKGLLMDKVTSQPALTPEGQQITAETVFTPETASGTIEMEFVFNARALQFHDVVVFENAYTAKSGVADELIHVGKHENINDLDQTVGFGEDDIEDTPIESTGDEMPIMPLLITIGVAFGAAAAFGLRRRFIK